jgi:hypothetical protein
MTQSQKSQRLIILLLILRHEETPERGGAYEEETRISDSRSSSSLLQLTQFEILQGTSNRDGGGVTTLRVRVVVHMCT